ncbi:MAG: aldolase/citrate lyase family protein [Actinobacteria bacterium]|nr:aldolase/citrate lyase family protein [Actinomycetota bacterium]
MRPNALKSKLVNNEPVLGMTMNYSSTSLVELAAIAGFDYVLFDGEHGPLDLADIERMVIAAEARSITAIARVPNLSADTALRFLDTGLQGILHPGINRLEDAVAAVGNTKYPPLGHRGLGIVRANDWGGIKGPEFIEASNEATIVLALIESIAGVDDVDRILDVEGLDVVWVGPVDLSQSLGLTGETDHPDVHRAIEQILGKARSAGKAAGIGVGDPSAIPAYRDMGATWFSVQARRLLVGAGKEFLEQARRILVA